MSWLMLLHCEKNVFSPMASPKRAPADVTSSSSCGMRSRWK